MNNIVKNTLNKSFLITRLVFSTLTFSQTAIANSSIPTTDGTSKIWVLWMEFRSMVGLVQGFSSVEAQLQIARVFEYIDNDIQSCFLASELQHLKFHF